jgi:ribosomal protein S4E
MISTNITLFLTLRIRYIIDVVQIKESKDAFRLLFDVKGRFVLHRINEDEQKYKLARVVATGVSAKGVPTLTTHDGRTIRFPDPAIKKNDTVRVTIETGKISGHIPFAAGQLIMVTKGRNQGRVGTIVSRERHPGSFDIAHIQDSAGHKFATRLSNVFVIGSAGEPMISLPKGKGIKLSILEEKAQKATKA